MSVHDADRGSGRFVTQTEGRRAGQSVERWKSEGMMMERARLTSFFNLVPHFLDLPLLDVGCGGIEAAYFVVLLVRTDGVR